MPKDVQLKTKAIPKSAPKKETTDKTAVRVDWNEPAKVNGLPNGIGLASAVNVAQINSAGTTSKHDQVLFDTGANCCITPNKDDFVGEFTETKDGKSVDGIGKGLQIHGQGHVAWTFEATNGMYRTLKLPCYYIPSTTGRIASVSVILKKYPTETVTVKDGMLELSGCTTARRPGIRVPFCTKSNLPLANAAKGMTGAVVHAGRTTKAGPALPKQKSGARSLTEATNANLSQEEKELMRWHYRLGHIGMRRVQGLFRAGWLATSERQRNLQRSAAKLTGGPLCAACQFAKQRRKTEPGSKKSVVPEDKDALKRDQLFPGQRVSVDHFSSSVLGRRFETYGKESNRDRYTGGCIFVDHATGFIWVFLQSRLNSHETLKGKQMFEELCAKYGVVVSHYLSDNFISIFDMLQQEDTTAMESPSEESPL